MLTVTIHIMAKKKKAVKAKEPVRLRFKELASGSTSLYLDIYRNGHRSYEFLKLYLVPEKDEESRAANANTLRAANAVKAQRIIELANGEAGISSASSRSKMLLQDWMRYYGEQKLKNGHSSAFSTQVDNTAKHLAKYREGAVTMRDVNKSFCLGFIDYLRTAEKQHGGKLSETSVATYFRCFNCALNFAVKEDVIPFNPISKISSDQMAKIPESTREHLTVEEVRALAAAECAKPSVKSAYLFSCMCGLRLGDVISLTWGDLIREGGKTKIAIVMGKTRKTLYTPLAPEALRWLPERNGAADTDRVFKLPCKTYIERIVKDWARSCGITKNVSFHTARHTFATMMLTLGADLFVTSELLGHTRVKTTQIYAKIVDKKKDEAISLLNGLFD